MSRSEILEVSLLGSIPMKAIGILVSVLQDPEAGAYEIVGNNMPIFFIQG